MRKEKLCIDCGLLPAVERRRCKECVLVHNRLRAKKYHKKDKVRYGIVKCAICGEDMIKNRPNQDSHGKCIRKIQRKCIDDYNKVTRDSKGCTIGRSMFNSTIGNLSLIPKHMHLHHLDENPFNNDPTNWMLLNRSNHAKLHAFLRKNWSLSWKQDSSNAENCWNTLREESTTTWLEKVSVKILELTEVSSPEGLKMTLIGQSAAEPLSEDFVYLCKVII